MKKLAYLFAAFILAGCGGSTQMVQNARIGDDANAKGYQEVMRIKADCSRAGKGWVLDRENRMYCLSFLRTML